MPWLPVKRDFAQTLGFKTAQSHCNIVLDVFRLQTHIRVRKQHHVFQSQKVMSDQFSIRTRVVSRAGLFWSGSDSGPGSGRIWAQS